MLKIVTRLLVCSLLAVLLSHHQIEAKPILFNFLVPQPSGSPNTRSDSVTTQAPFPNIFAQKLRFLTSLLQGSGSFGITINKFGSVSTTTSTTSKPDSTTELETVYEPEPTESIDSSSSTTEESKENGSTTKKPYYTSEKPDVDYTTDKTTEYEIFDSTTGSGYYTTTKNPYITTTTGNQYTTKITTTRRPFIDTTKNPRPSTTTTTYETTEPIKGYTYETPSEENEIPSDNSSINNQYLPPPASLGRIDYRAFY